MTLPQNVKDAVGNVDACRLETFDADWLTIKAHLLSYEAEIEWLQAGLAKHVDRVCELESRLAAANALLRTIAAYTPPAHECARGCPKETCEACKLAKYLQGAGDEGGRPA